MAVPKKRRIGNRFLNRGFRGQYKYSQMLNSTISRFYLSYLSKLDSQRSLNAFRGSRSTGPSLLPNSKVLPKTFGKSLKTIRSLNIAPAPLSYRALKAEFSSNAIKNFRNSIPEKFMGVLRLNHSRLPLSLRHVPYTFLALPGFGWMLADPSFKLNLKRGLLLFQINHKWGGQGNYLLRKWELGPRYLFLSPRAPSLGGANFGYLPLFPWGLLGLNYPKNLHSPKGPTLKDLWTYAKENPNEGYWIYCLWLQVKKRWKRLIRFPVQYLLKRNILRRTLFYHNYLMSITMYKKNVAKYYKYIRAKKSPLKFRESAFKNPHSLFTRITLLISNHTNFGKSKLNSPQKRADFLKGCLGSSPSKLNKTFISLTLSRVIRLVKKPWF